MAKGVCYRARCAKIIDLNQHHNTVCGHCGGRSVNAKAAERYAALSAVPEVQAGDPAQAFKSDAGKVQFDLLEDGAPNALLEIAKVMSWAVEVKGYHPHSWQEIPDAIRRYKAALGRHRNAIARGERYDPESGLLHWAHAACCVIFITELELRSK